MVIYLISPINKKYLFEIYELSTHMTLSLLVAIFCRLLINIANSLDPDQEVGPDLDLNRLAL